MSATSCVIGGMLGDGGLKDLHLPRSFVDNGELFKEWSLARLQTPLRLQLIGSAQEEAKRAIAGIDQSSLAKDPLLLLWRTTEVLKQAGIKENLNKLLTPESKSALKQALQSMNYQEQAIAWCLLEGVAISSEVLRLRFLGQAIDALIDRKPEGCLEFLRANKELLQQYPGFMVDLKGCPQIAPVAQRIEREIEVEIALGKSAFSALTGLLAARREGRNSEGVLEFVALLAAADKDGGHRALELLASSPRLPMLLKQYICDELPGDAGNLLANSIVARFENTVKSEAECSALLSSLLNRAPGFSGKGSWSEPQEQLTEGELKSNLLASYKSAFQTISAFHNNSELALAKEFELQPVTDSNRDQQQRLCKIAALREELNLLRASYLPLLAVDVKDQLWLHDFRSLLLSDYVVRERKIFNQLSSLGANLSRIAISEQEQFVALRVSFYITQNPDSELANWEQSGFTRYFTVQELEAQKLAANTKPLVEQISQLECQWAVILELAKKDPDKQAVLKKELVQGAQKTIDQAYLKLAEIAKTPWGKNLDIPALKLEVDVVRRDAINRVSIIQELQTLIASGKDSLADIENFCKKEKQGFEINPRSGGLNFFLKPYGKIVPKEEMLRMVLDNQLAQLEQKWGEKLKSSAQTLVNQLQLEEFEPKKWAEEGLKVGEFRLALLPFWSELVSDVDKLAERYPGEIDPEGIKKSILVNLRRKQIEQWLEKNAVIVNTDGRYLYTFEQLKRKLADSGAFSVITLEQAGALICQLRTKRITSELLDYYESLGAKQMEMRRLSYEKNETKLAEVRRSYDELNQQIIPSKLAAIEKAHQDYPEYYDRAGLSDMLGNAVMTGGTKVALAWAEDIQNANYAETKRREEMIFLERCFEETKDALKTVPKIGESTLDFFFAHKWGFVRAYQALKRFENPYTAYADGTAEFILYFGDLFEKHAPGGSVFGDYRKLVDIGDCAFIGSAFPLTHLGAATVTPAMNIGELQWIETCRLSYNLSSFGTNMLTFGPRFNEVRFEEFSRMMKEQPLLQASGVVRDVSEALAMAALIVQSGGVGAIAMGGRTSRLLSWFGMSSTNAAQTVRMLRALGVSTGFSGVMSYGEELKDWEHASWARWSRNTLKSTAVSLRFMAGLSIGGEYIVRLGYGGKIPQSSRELLELAQSSPQDYQRLMLWMRRARTIGDGVDFCDGSSDGGESFSSFSYMTDSHNVAGTWLTFFGSGFDVCDWEAAGGASHLNSTVAAGSMDSKREALLRAHAVSLKVLSEGGSELEALREGAKILAEGGMEVDLTTGKPVIRAIADGKVPRKPAESELTAYLLACSREPEQTDIRAEVLLRAKLEEQIIPFGDGFDLLARKTLNEVRRLRIPDTGLIPESNQPRFIELVSALECEAERILIATGTNYLCRFHPETNELIGFEIIANKDGSVFNKEAARFLSTKGTALVYSPRTIFRQKSSGIFDSGGAVIDNNQRTLYLPHDALTQLTNSAYVYHEYTHAMLHNIRAEGAQNLLFGECIEFDFSDILAYAAEMKHRLDRMTELEAEGRLTAAVAQELVELNRQNAKILNEIATVIISESEGELLQSLRTGELEITYRCQRLSDRDGRESSIVYGVAQFKDQTFKLDLGSFEELKTAKEDLLRALFVEKVEALLVTAKDIKAASSKLLAEWAAETWNLGTVDGRAAYSKQTAELLYSLNSHYRWKSSVYREWKESLGQGSTGVDNGGGGYSADGGAEARQIESAIASERAIAAVKSGESKVLFECLNELAEAEILMFLSDDAANKVTDAICREERNRAGSINELEDDAKNQLWICLNKQLKAKKGTLNTLHVVRAREMPFKVLPTGHGEHFDKLLGESIPERRERSTERKELAKAYRASLGPEFEVAVFEESVEPDRKKFEIAIDHLGLPVAYVGFTVVNGERPHYHLSNVVIRPQAKGCIKANDLYALRQFILEQELGGKPLASSHHFLGGANAEMFNSALKSIVTREKKRPNESEQSYPDLTEEDLRILQIKKPELQRHAFEVVMRSWNKGSSDNWRRYPRPGSVEYSLPSITTQTQSVSSRRITKIEVTNIRLCPPYVPGSSLGVPPYVWLKDFRQTTTEEGKAEKIAKLTVAQVYLLCELVDIVQSDESPTIREAAEKKAFEIADQYKDAGEEFDIEASLEGILVQSAVIEPQIDADPRLLLSAEPESSCIDGGGELSADFLNLARDLRPTADPAQLAAIDSQRGQLGKLADEYAENKQKIGALEQRVADARAKQRYYLNPAYWRDYALLLLHRLGSDVTKERYSEQLTEPVFAPCIPASPIKEDLPANERIRSIALNNLYRLPEYQNFSPVRDIERTVEYPAAERVKRILFVCRGVGLGDIVHAEPIVQSLQSRYPGAVIDIVSSGSVEYWQSKGWDGEVVRVNNKGKDKQISDETMERVSDLVSNSQHDLIVTLNDHEAVQRLAKTVTGFPGTRTVIGYQQWNYIRTAVRETPYYLQELCYDHNMRPIPNTKRPDLDGEMPLDSAALGFNFIRASIDGEASLAASVAVKLTPEEKSRVREELAEFYQMQHRSIDGEEPLKVTPETRFLCLNPFSSSPQSKDLPWKVYAEGLIAAYQDLREGNVLVGINLPSKKEQQDDLRRIVDFVNHRCPNFPIVVLVNEDGAPFNQERYIRFVLAADFVIGVDTSSRHLAAAARSPSLTLFRAEGEGHYSRWRHQTLSSNSFQSQVFNFGGPDHSQEAISYLADSIKALTGRSELFLPERAAEGEALRHELLKDTEQLASNLAEMSEEEFRAAFHQLVRKTFTFTKCLSPSFKSLADGRIIQQWGARSQLAEIESLLEPSLFRDIDSREVFIQQWLSSNVFFLLSFQFSQGEN